VAILLFLSLARTLRHQAGREVGRRAGPAGVAV